MLTSRKYLSHASLIWTVEADRDIRKGKWKVSIIQSAFLSIDEFFLRMSFRCNLKHVTGRR
jgi:hypothetical protein